MVLFALALVACSGSDSIDDGVAAPVLPRFVAATGDLAELIDAPFTAGALPVELGGGQVDPLSGSVIVNSETGPTDEESIAMHWYVDDGFANFVVSDFDRRTESGQVQWRPVSAWRLGLDNDTVVVVGTLVCEPAPHTYDWQNGEFVAVTNRDQNEALGAWTIGRQGPTPYAELATLECERFVP